MRESVLIIEHDQELASLTAEVLTDEGFVVSVLVNVHPAAIQGAVLRVEPDVVLLDGASAAGYGWSWSEAIRLHERDRFIPVIMFTAHEHDQSEAQLGTSERSRRAAFAGILSKPFELQALVDVVRRAVQQPFGTLRRNFAERPALLGATRRRV